MSVESIVHQIDMLIAETHRWNEQVARNKDTMGEHVFQANNARIARMREALENARLDMWSFQGMRR